MTSPIAVSERRSTACYDLPPDYVTWVRQLSQELSVPAGDIVTYALSLLRKGDAVHALLPLRVPTFKPGRYAYRLKLVR